MIGLLTQYSPPPQPTVMPDATRALGGLEERVVGRHIGEGRHCGRGADLEAIEDPDGRERRARPGETTMK